MSSGALTAPYDPYFGHSAESFVHILRWRAENQPERLAYTFVPDGRSTEARLTYGQLDRTARRIAAELATVATPGERALLFFPTGQDFFGAFLGCLYAGIIAIPLYLPRANRKITRLESVVEDSGARLALVQQSKLDDMRRHLGERAGEGGIQLIATDGIADMSSREWERRLPAAADIAYLQYTSGSTSVPKGVMVTHGNLVYNCAYMAETYGMSADSVSVTWLPHFHDMGLIDGLFNPLFSGFPVVVMSPTQFAQRPLIWLDAISRHRATHTTAPNFGYDLCIRKIKPEQRDELDLSSWEVACSGAEPVRSETLDQFTEYFAPCGFRRETFMPGYGLAEATLMVTGGDKGVLPIVRYADGPELEKGRVLLVDPGDPKARPVVGCGHTRMQTEVAIVDPATFRRCPPDGVGEIWVGGPTLPTGYWERPAETYETFRAFTEDGAGPFMRTGDLGFLQEGDLFIAGRLKDLIIIRGGNYYPQDIEWVAEKASRVFRAGRAAAFSIEGDAGEERLVVAQEVERSFRKAGEEEFESAAGLLRGAVAEEFDIEVALVVLVQPGGVPMTSSGKIQRRACRQALLDGSLDVLWKSPLRQGVEPVVDDGPRMTGSELEGLRPAEMRRRLIGLLRRQVASVTGAEESDVLPDTPLGSLGIDSLRAGELTSELEQGLEIELPSTLVWNFPTIAQIADHIATQLQARPPGPKVPA